MKQIIVNVSGLSVEEKKQVNEALAKIMGAQVCNPTYWGKVSTMYVPSLDRVTVGFYYRTASQTHTPQQVLEMAGMATKRKVRRDFDPKQPISVDVSGCTEEEKKEVQQAFFDVGIKWDVQGAEFRNLGAAMYTNSTPTFPYRDNLLYGISPRIDSISHRQFLELVYEQEQQGHIHAHLMAQYAEDALTHPEPWKLWEMKLHFWVDCHENPTWLPHVEYRRKPKTHIVHGVEVPDLRFVPVEGVEYYIPAPDVPQWHLSVYFTSDTAHECQHIRGLCYEYTEEGKQAAILHAKAWLGIHPE